MFCSRNPSFLEKGGKISILAHSLGSVIAYDILTLWDIELRHLSHDSTTGTGFLTESLHYLRSVTSRGSVESMETSAEGRRKENLRVELAKARSQVMKLEAMIASEVEHESRGANNGSNDCPYALKFKVCMVKLCHDWCTNGSCLQSTLSETSTPRWKLWTWHYVYFLEKCWIIVSGKLPTYSAPKPTLTLTSRLRQNAGLGEG